MRTKEKAFRFTLVGIALTLGAVNIWGYLSESLAVNTIALILTWIGLVVILFASIARLIAKSAEEKGRSYNAFYWLSILFSPLIMGVIVATLSPLPGSKKYIAATVEMKESSEVSHAEQIDKLGGLLEKGLITQAEFEAKKKDLLDRI